MHRSDFDVKYAQLSRKVSSQVAHREQRMKLRTRCVNKQEPQCNEGKPIACGSCWPHRGGMGLTGENRSLGLETMARKPQALLNCHVFRILYIPVRVLSLYVYINKVISIYLFVYIFLSLCVYSQQSMSDLSTYLSTYVPIEGNRGRFALGFGLTDSP